jgi:hypothetical protein
MLHLGIVVVLQFDQYDHLASLPELGVEQHHLEMKWFNLGRRTSQENRVRHATARAEEPEWFARPVRCPSSLQKTTATDVHEKLFDSDRLLLSLQTLQQQGQK